MVFVSPSWVPALEATIPSATPVGDFVVDGILSPHADVKAPVVACASSGKTYTIEEIRQKVDFLARSLSQELGWQPNVGEPWDKVLGIYSFNTADYLILSWAVHRLNGIVLTLHPTNSAAETEAHLLASKCRVLFTSASLFESCLGVTDDLGIFRDRIYLLNVADEPLEAIEGHQTFDQLVDEGAKLSPLEPLQWKDGQGSQVAYLAATSGTSGMQKLAKITHFNMIANILQAFTYENVVKQNRQEVALLPLPLSHTYALESSHMMIWRRDLVVLQPRFDMMKVLEATARHRVERLFLVPPIIFAMVKNAFLLKMHDISSVDTIVSGAAPLKAELAGMVHQLKPSWKVITGYGLTESSIIATFTSLTDTMPGSSGSLLPLVELRLLSPSGTDISALETPGEVLLRGPNIIPGYLNDEEATRALIDENGWLHTGDVGMLKLSPKSNQHLFIVDRMRDMIKVKGLQVAPVEIEAFLMTHPAVADVGVVGVADELAGERAKAFIVRAPGAMAEASEEEVRAEISGFVEGGLGELCWLGERIEFIKEIPRNQSGKVLKAKLRALG